MVGSLQHQPSLFYAAFEHQASLIKDDLLDPIDALLDDDQLIALVSQALGRRYPRSSTMGRDGIAPDRLLRCCVLKHIKGWSLRELEREVRCSLVYRRFTRFDHERIPTYSTFSRSFAALGPATTRRIHEAIVKCAQHRGIAAGRRLRTDTTVVETNIHHPQDSTLLGDGIRVLTRSLKRIARECEGGHLKVVERTRSTTRRILEIHRAARTFTDGGKARLVASYHKLVDLTQRTVRQAERACADLVSGKLPVSGDGTRVVVAEERLRHFVPLVRRVIAQTKARVFGGDIHVEGKVLSLFEEHTQVIRKGKAHKPTEFGRLVRLDEVENGIVSNYCVAAGNPSDTEQWEPALLQHREQFGRAPRTATADRGYWSGKNERIAREQGVVQVALPARGPLSESHRSRQRTRGFRRALSWRAGIESRIATLKHRFGMVRATYKGERGFDRYVGWCIIAQNLVSIARTDVRRRKE
jgi:IS5 family transposase